MLKEVVFNGGGARGAGITNVLVALQSAHTDENISLWDGIETIAGTSVGSLTAAIFSVSPEWSELKEDIFDKNILEILEMNQIFLPANLSLDPLEKFINTYLKKHIKKYLDHNPDLQEFLPNIDKEDYQVTFQDLASLHEHKPNKFKNLIITSTSSNNGKSQLNLYDYEKTPNTSIAKACAASSAVYPIFKPVKLGDSYQYDGGFSEPLPSEYFVSKTTPSQRLLFVFGPGPSMLGKIWQRTLYGRPNPEIVVAHSQEEAIRQQQEQEAADQAEKSLLQANAMDATTPKTYRESTKVSILERIYVWIDNEKREVHYLLPNAAGVSHTMSFSELKIADNLLVTRENFGPYLANFYTKLVLRGHLKSILGDLSPIWLLNYFSWAFKLVIGFSIKIGTLFESLCHRLKSVYPHNTVVLTSTLLGNSFQEGEKTKRTIAATYYLDTMNFLALYNYICPKEQHFYEEIIHQYLIIYQTSLHAVNLQTDWYTVEYDKQLNPRVLYEMIKDDVTANPTSSRAMALTWAVELHLGQKTVEEVLEELNEKAQAKCRAYGSIFYGHSFKKQDDIMLPRHNERDDLSNTK